MNTSLKSLLSTLVLAAVVLTTGCDSESETDRQARIRRELEERRAENRRLVMYSVGFTTLGLGSLAGLAVGFIVISKKYAPFAAPSRPGTPLPSSSPASTGSSLQSNASAGCTKTENQMANGAAPQKSFVIDGTNVCRSYNRGGFRLETLLALATSLVERGHAFECYFDASTKYAAERAGDASQREAYIKLLDQYPAFFRQTPAGEPADDTILLRANQKGCSVISNDLFNKPEDGHLSRYPWIKIRGRVIRGGQYDGRLLVAQLGTDVPVAPSLAQALARFQAGLDNRKVVARALN